MNILPPKKFQIDLVTANSLGYCQNDSEFFCLSDICKDLNLKVIDFLNYELTQLTLIDNLEEATELKNLTIESFVKEYPQFTKYNKSNNSINSGLWLHSIFLKPLCHFLYNEHKLLDSMPTKL